MYVESIENLQKLSQGGVDLVLESTSAVNKCTQDIAIEISDYSRKVFEEGIEVAERVLNAGSIEYALAIQYDYAKSSYEDFVGQFTRISDLVVKMSKDAVKPFEGALAY